jgi:predicted nucleic acid-binding protein
MKRSAPELVVADAGPLIGLAIIGGLPWIERLFQEVLIPEAVAAELCLDSAMPGAAALAAARDRGWLKIVAVAEVPAHLLATVDRGEAEAITLAKRHAVPMLIDESRGRTAARSEGVQVFGSGAVLIRAKERRIIRQVRPHLDALTQAQYRLSEALRHEILRQAGEVASPTPD